MRVQAYVVLLEERDLRLAVPQHDLDKVLAQRLAFLLTVHRLVPVDVAVDHLTTLSQRVYLHDAEGRDFPPDRFGEGDGPARRSGAPHEAHILQLEVFRGLLGAQRRQKEQFAHVLGVHGRIGAE